MAIVKSTHKVGPSRGVARSRIWLEGDRVLAAGFAPGMMYTREWTADTLTLALGEGEGRATRGKVSGKGEKPILDIVGDKVREVFGAHCERVEVSYEAGRITVRRA